MQQSSHPDDERLAALAASEPDALADSPLVTHVSGCSRCAPIVDDLRSLQSALGELPDVQPSRSLRFLPPVPEPATRGSRWVGLLRGVTGPAMAVAILLIVVGAFGTAAKSGLGATGGAATFLSRDQAGAAASSRAPAPANSESSKGHTSLPGATASPLYPVAAGKTPSASAAASATPGESTSGNFQGDRTSDGAGGAREPETTSPPYGLMLGSGVVLLAVALVARGYLRRRSPA
jgi:hypothetical protein